MTLAWIYLIIAGLLEIGWPLGLKLADLPNMKIWGIGLAIFSMTLSGFLLWFSLKEIPIERPMPYGPLLVPLVRSRLAFWFLETPIFRYAGLVLPLFC